MSPLHDDGHGIIIHAGFHLKLLSNVCTYVI